ncbi:MAG: radical SAM family heme chaperone HemW [Acholeplasmataceae bacterium]|nr:radical SAM family heme chaperone HemW [Acholeplasmataceae bacterium]
MTGLYIHIPFCEAICHYCDFVKRVPSNKAMINTYLETLGKELNTYRDRFSDVSTIYVGGGTPSMLDLSQSRELFEQLKEINADEYTIEVNPESYTPSKGQLMKAYGVNRISLGVQTFDGGLLTYLNRKHTNDQVFEVVKDLRAQGISNISIDLIFGIPGQTEAMIQEDLRQVGSLGIKHISWYQLILEEKTVFWHLFKKGQFHPMEDDEAARWYEHITTSLGQMGFNQYEISSYAIEGHQSVHNTLYWTMADYIGCGLGAHGFLDGIRYENHQSLERYQRSYVKTSYETTKTDRMADTLIFGLRMNKGVNIDQFEKTFMVSPFLAYDALDRHLEDGLVEVVDRHLRLTERGRLLGNQVFMAFV